MICVHYITQNNCNSGKDRTRLVIIEWNGLDFDFNFNFNFNSLRIMPLRLHTEKIHTSFFVLSCLLFSSHDDETVYNNHRNETTGWSVPLLFALARNRSIIVFLFSFFCFPDLFICCIIFVLILISIIILIYYTY
jgi:hypothetical protein